MFNRKLTKTLKKVSGFVAELNAGISANNDEQEIIHDSILELEDKSITIEVETRQAKRMLALLNG